MAAVFLVIELHDQRQHLIAVLQTAGSTNPGSSLTGLVVVETRAHVSERCSRSAVAAAAALVWHMDSAGLETAGQTSVVEYTRHTDVIQAAAEDSTGLGR